MPTVAEIKEKCGDPWVESGPGYSNYVTMCVVLVCFGGVMSGLQQGIFQLNEFDILSKEEDVRSEISKCDKSMDSEALPFLRKDHTISEAKKPERFRLIYLNCKLKLLHLLRSLISRTHWTLVTLLVANSLAMEALPIFMDIIMPKQYAILYSVTLLVLFGEIIPQSLCLKFPLALALLFTLPIWIIVLVLSPICYPISLLLDLAVGKKEYHHLNRTGLKELAKHHSLQHKGPLGPEETDIIIGALSLNTTTVKDAFLPLEKIFMVDYEDIVNDTLLRKISKSGFSRIPVYKGNESRIVGLLLTKTLIRFNCNTSEEARVKDLHIYPYLRVKMDTCLLNLLSRFRAGRSHMAIVIGDSSLSREKSNSISSVDFDNSFEKSNKNFEDAVGIITLENIIESLLQRDISDEKDTWEHSSSSLAQKILGVKTFKGKINTMLSKYREEPSGLHVPNSLSQDSTNYGTL